MNKTVMLFFTLALLVAAASGLSSQTEAGGWVPLVGAKGEIADAASPPLLPAKCITVLGQRICVEDNRNGGNAKGKGESAGNPGERSCPPGYVVLDKPNKYGAFCEPQEGFPESKPQQAKSCGFGMSGSPPNCNCNFGEFLGYRGCPSSQHIYPSMEAAAFSQKEFVASCEGAGGKSVCKKVSKPEGPFECTCYALTYNPDGTRK